MNAFIRAIWWCLVCCALLLGLTERLAQLADAATATQDTCPPGLVPADTISLGELVLSNGATPYTMVTLTRLTLQAGESLDTNATNPEVYYVESGVLKYPFQPRQLSIMAAAPCTPATGPLTAGGTITVDAHGMIIVSQGQALILEAGATGPITNGGTAPLMLLQMAAIAPQLDPVSGLPIVDPAIVAREQSNAFEERKETCKAQKKTGKRRDGLGTPVTNAQPDQDLRAPLATPAVSTTGWASDARQTQPVPRACQSP
jgi:hypothetical protein